MSMKKVRIALAFTIIAGLLVWLTISASNENMQYYVDIKDLKAMGAGAHDTGLRVKGKLVPGSLVRTPSSLDVQFTSVHLLVSGCRKINGHRRDRKLPPEKRPMVCIGVGPIVR